MFFAYEKLPQHEQYYLIFAGIRIKKLCVSQTFVTLNYISQSIGGLSYEEFAAV